MHIRKACNQSWMILWRVEAAKCGNSRFDVPIVSLTNSSSGPTTASEVWGCSLRRIREDSLLILALVSFSESLGDWGSGE
jgi:hypothetical protein